MSGETREVYYDLERFSSAQAFGRDNYNAAYNELIKGRKESHWIWWIFPQLKGLGTSSNSRYYGIEDREEARAYLLHPTLGPRYLDCVRIVEDWLKRGQPYEVTLGSELDALKYESSKGLFLP